jgi:hypothetical protein
MPTGTQIIRSIEHHLLYPTNVRIWYIYFEIKQRASFFNKKEKRVLYIYLFEYPFITKTCKIEAIEKIMDKLKHN